MDGAVSITISPQGQITIPKAWRDLLGLNAGKKLVISLVDWVKGKALVIHPEPKSWADYVAGTGKGLWGKDSDAYIKQERDSWERKSWE
jgi:AbrB family looped-hinge helix DNA binding protein